MNETTSAPLEPLIRLEHVTKRYSGVEEPAVRDLTLDVYPGEILVLVGPSGCGKSTTLRLINRMIEPSAGTILYEGEDVTKADPNALRRRIGYVIQQVGLFPHRTIAENVATVPRLLRWPKKRIKERVDELLELVGMDPAIYRDRYPSELSGGQAQRVGVARALGADPDVLLMDEPFGAIDPITRDRLQNEFLRLQGELRKTIVFVTHDIDEAVKMGDRIAIMREGSEIAQIDRPEVILTDPADDFVENFLGSGAVLKTLTLRRVRDIELASMVTLRRPVHRGQALQAMADAGSSTAVLLDDGDHPLRWIDERSLNSAGAIESAGRPITVQVQPEDTLQDALSAMLTTSSGMAVVVDARGRYLGGCTIEGLASLLLHTGNGNGSA
ncbi:MAG: ABC transporter ATP-binding protein [Candidatus Nanopelagicales bacterium]|jgi:osmoprotectant transport system ATP-binding protein|nr:ABC transporter ATP-binding protein [Candidatus Nanopelagicales bacterium]MDP4906354.1 ABC transporter ATP-binding protein [Candidatus Nanopelagicales bacterium]MDP4974727.1 ABC transporter ATP-binding protein [Candidatus Nanopelagicales bacterium]